VGHYPQKYSQGKFVFWRKLGKKNKRQDIIHIEKKSVAFLLWESRSLDMPFFRKFFLAENKVSKL